MRYPHAMLCIILALVVLVSNWGSKEEQVTYDLTVVNAVAPAGTSSQCLETAAATLAGGYVGALAYTECSRDIVRRVQYYNATGQML